MENDEKLRRAQIVYAGNFDFYDSRRSLEKNGIMCTDIPTRGQGNKWTKEELKKRKIIEAQDVSGLIQFSLTHDINVIMSRTGTVQVSWSNEEEKIKCMAFLEDVLVSNDGKKVTLEPKEGNFYGVKHGAKYIPTFWCDEEILYQSSSQFELIQHEMDAILDLYHRLDYDSAQKRAEMLYSMLPQEWQRKLESLFKGHRQSQSLTFQSHWISVFIAELQKLRFNSSKKILLWKRKEDDIFV
jgi:hypothetical protein